MIDLSFSTGIEALDEVLHGIRAGDNIVFQVDDIEDYVPFVNAFFRNNKKHGRALIYFRFADHKPLIPLNVEAVVFELHPEIGFEHFIDEIFKVIEKYGRGACYIFDSLSELAVDWYSDRMVANFFMLTCPYLFDFDTETYFALLRNRHSQYTTSKIYETAQVILDIYNKNGSMYIHPLKVWKRHSSTMYMLHIWKENKFVPVYKSSETSEILTEYAQPWVDFTTKIQDIWSKTFTEAHSLLKETKSGECSIEQLDLLKDKIIRMALTRDEKLFKLIKKYLELKDLVNIGRRMIGTGLIGGKSLGMLLAQSILKNSDPKWERILEKHDSFFIGSDVFYTYLVINKGWWTRYKIRKSKKFIDLAKDARDIMLKGDFPEDIIEQFKNLLSYYGQSPIIVRSSSLLEDAYGSAFSGKYDSIFLTNQGPPKRRLNEFMNAVRQVYASTLSEDALNYRQRRGLLDKDEQMAILVQRVSGSRYGNLFYPQLAGVGYSFNPFIWDPSIEPQSGLLRLVFGLGTRAVDRYDDDYTRIVALSAPEKRPEANESEKRKHNQKKVDILDLESNEFKTMYFDEIANLSDELPIELFGERDYQAEKNLRQRNRERIVYYLDLDKTIMNSMISSHMKEILKTLEDVYDYPVDVEFTVNFLDENTHKIYVVQCRPFQVKSKYDQYEGPSKIELNDLLIQSTGPIVGNGIAQDVDVLIYVVPEEYAKLDIQHRYEIARLIGKINQQLREYDERIVFLAGPGRWATSSPSLGIPVSFHEINSISIICEIAEMHDNLSPDVSLGTHFFNDLVETDMLYVAVNPKKEKNVLNKKEIMGLENHLLSIIPDAKKFEHVVKLHDVKLKSNHGKIKIYANPLKQDMKLYLSEE